MEFGPKCGKKWKDTVEMTAKGLQIHRQKVGGLWRVHGR